MEGNVQIPVGSISTKELTRLIFEALKKSTYGGTKMGKPHPGDHKEE